MTVRAKFKCTEITDRCYAGYQSALEQKTVTLEAISDPENKTWAKYTPSGKLTMLIDNPDAWAQFKIGECYFLDFSPAPAKEADEAK